MVLVFFIRKRNWLANMAKVKRANKHAANNEKITKAHWPRVSISL